jgi:hypothetical protein
MKYHDGTSVSLGDVVRVPIPTGTARARVVMLGETYEHLGIDPRFVAWVSSDRVLESTSIIVEWMDGTPFAHSDPKYAPVGRYMFSPLDEHVTLEA